MKQQGALQKTSAQDYDGAMNASTVPNKSAGAAALRRNAQGIGLVGIDHLTSHFSQLLLAPLFS